MNELALINTVLAEHGVKAYTFPKNVDTGKPMIARTPSYTMFGIDPYAKGVKISSIRALMPELTHALKKERNGPVDLRWGENPFCLEVPHIEPKPLPLTDSVFSDLPAHTAPLGRSYEFFKPQDHYINIRMPDQAHLLLAGTNGSGKSTALRVVISALAWNNSPMNIQFVMCDLKNRGLVPFRTLPHTIFWHNDPLECAKAIQWVHDEVVRRTQLDSGAVDGLPRLVLVVEEASFLAMDGVKDVFTKWLPRIAVAGRELGVHIFLTAQKPDSGLIGGQLKSQLTVRLVGRVLDPGTSYWTTGQRNAGAEKLPGFGNFLLINGRLGAEISDTHPRRVIGYHVDTAMCREIVRRCMARWPERPASINMEQMTSSIDVALLRNYELAKQLLLENYDITTGKLRHGTKKLLIKKVLGESAVTGGSNDKVADAIVAHHARVMAENYKATTTTG